MVQFRSFSSNSSGKRRLTNSQAELARPTASTSAWLNDANSSISHHYMSSPSTLAESARRHASADLRSLASPRSSIDETASLASTVSGSATSSLYNALSGLDILSAGETSSASTSTTHTSNRRARRGHSSATPLVRVPSFSGDSACSSIVSSFGHPSPPAYYSTALPTPSNLSNNNAADYIRGAASTVNDLISFATNTTGATSAPSSLPMFHSSSASSSGYTKGHRNARKGSIFLPASSNTSPQSYKKTDDGYSTSQHNHHSASAASTPATTTPASSWKNTWWTAAKRLSSLLIQSAMFALAIYGGYMLVVMKFGGVYMRIPVYSQYEIQEAGWERPLLIPAIPRKHGDASVSQTTQIHRAQHKAIQDQQEQQQSSDPDYVDVQFESEDEGLDQQRENTNPPAASRPTQIVKPWTLHPDDNSALPSYTLSEDLSTSSSGRTSLQIYDFDRHHNISSSKLVSDLHILILTPLKNAEDVLQHFFALVENLDHPKENMSIGLLVGDEEDETGQMVNDWAVNQERKGEYRKITLLKKDFGLPHPNGEDRHKHWLQAQRRELLAKARTLLLTATLEPSVDWVLWLDSDLSEVPRTLISDLLYYGNAGIHPANQNILLNEEDKEPFADVITPNIMRRKGAGKVQGYDLNNWSETPKSLKMKAKLPKDRVIWEGNRARPTYRTLLARSWTKPNVSSSWDDSSSHYPYTASVEGPTNLYDPDSDAYIGRIMELDGVGGVATLVRGWVHRFGAVFPSWSEDHQVETEGFGIMARQLGARMVGLPNYVVFHHSKEWPSRLPGTVKHEDGTPW